MRTILDEAIEGRPDGPRHPPPGETLPPTTTPPVGYRGLAAEPAASVFLGGPATTPPASPGTRIPSPTDPSQELSLDASATRLVSTHGWSVSAEGAIPPRAVYYLVTGENAHGEGTMGYASNGLPRPNVAPCP